MSNSIKDLIVRVGRESLLPFYLRYRRPLAPLKAMALVVPGLKGLRAAIIADDSSSRGKKASAARSRPRPVESGAMTQGTLTHLNRETLVRTAEQAGSMPVSLGVARHLFRLKNFRSASRIAGQIDPNLLAPHDLFFVIKCLLSDTEGVRADVLLDQFLARQDHGRLSANDQKALADVIIHSGMCAEVKLSRLERILHNSPTEGLRRHVRFLEFRVRLAVSSNLDVLDFAELDQLNIDNPAHQLRFVPHLKATGYEYEAQRLLERLHERHSVNKAILFSLLRYDPDWPGINLHALPQEVLAGQDILHIAHEQKDANATYALVFARSLEANISQYPHADIYQKDRILSSLVRLDLLDEVERLTQADPQLPDTVLATVAGTGLRYLLKDEFLSAKDRFTRVLEENPSDGVAAQGLRLVLPRSGGNMETIVALRDRIGYGIAGAGRPGSRSDIGSEKTISLLMQGKYREGLYAKRHAAHWKLLKRVYGHKFFNFERLPHQSSQKHLFLIGDEGVGDEVRTAQFYGGLAKRFARLTVTCDPRLRNMFERSFPTVEFIPVERYRKGLIKPEGDDRRITGLNLKLFQYLTERCRPAMDAADYISFGQTLFFNRFIGEIPKPPIGGYLVPNGRNVMPERTNKLRVGILWRSHFKSMWRKFMYLKVQDFAPLLKIEGIDLWSFQHCIDAEERAFCLTHGIHVIDNIDLFNDFESLGSCLQEVDLVIGISSLPIELAAAVGTPVWMLGFSPENYFLRTAGGRTPEDQLTANSTVVAPDWVDFTAPASECISMVLEEACHRLTQLKASR